MRSRCGAGEHVAEWEGSEKFAFLSRVMVVAETVVAEVEHQSGERAYDCPEWETTQPSP